MTATQIDNTLRNSRSGTVALDIAVKPAELFPNGDSTVTSVTATNSYVLVERDRNGQLERVLYNEANRPTPIDSDMLPHIRLTMSEVNQKLRELGDSVIVLSGEATEGEVSFQDLANALNLSTTEGNRLRKKIETYASDGKVTARSLQGIQSHYIDLDAKLTSDPSEKYIAFERGDYLCVFRTVDEYARPLPPNRWVKTEIKNRTDISSQQIAETPVLAEYAADSRGKVLDGLNRSVSLTNGVVTVVDTRQGTRMLSEAARAYAIDPINRGHIYFIGSDNKLRHADIVQGNGKSNSFSPKPLPFNGDVVDMRFDPHGNFLAVVVEQGEQRNLHLIERDTLRSAGTIENVQGSFDFNRYGDIYFVDGDKRLRHATTNLHTFSPDGLAEARELEKRRLQVLLSSASNIALPNIPKAEENKDAKSRESKSTASMRDSIIAQASSEVTEKLGPEVGKAENIEQLDHLARQISALKSTDQYREYPEVFIEVEEKLAEKIDGLETKRLVKELEKHAEFLKEEIGPEHLIALHESWGQLERLRRSLVISNPEVRRSVDKEFSEQRKTSGFL